MQLVNIDKLKKYYGDKLILDIDKFEILEFVILILFYIVNSCV